MLINRMISIKNIWEPMQNAVEGNLTEFIRHFLMREGAVVNQGDVYYSLKEKITKEDAIPYLTTLSKFANYYQRLLDPQKEPDAKIQKSLKKLNKIEVTTAYPLLMNFYDALEQGKIDKASF